MRKPKIKVSEKDVVKQIVVFSTPAIYYKVVPKVRMTRQGRFSPRAQRYLKSQEALAWEFKRHYKGVPINYPVMLSFTVAYSDNRLRDIDNIAKAIMDSLQYKGMVLENDRFVVGFRLCKRLNASETMAPIDWVQVRLDKTGIDKPTQT